MMKTTIKNILLATLATAMLVSCKKDKEDEVEFIPVYQNPSSINDKILNGAIKGEVTGNTGDDSTYFEFDFKHIYEYGYQYSEWEATCTNCKTSREAPDLVNIQVQRTSNFNIENYSYLRIYSWDLNGDIDDAEFEIYINQYVPLDNGKTLSYYQELTDDDVTINSVSFDKNTGDFSVSLIGTIQEGDNDGSTGNPGTITMNFSGRLYSDEVIHKEGK